MNAKLKETIRRFLPTTIRDHRIQRGPLRGARIYTSWHDYPGAILGTTETPLLAWLARQVKSGETWLDIGAHYGYTSIALSRLVGPSGRVFAFEPVAATAACLARTRELNHFDQLTVVPFGLSADTGLRLHRLPVFRGMAERTGPPTAPRQVIVTASLDSLWSDEAVHGIKIDVQGMEADVLAGMRNVLSRWKPGLVVEFHRGVDRRSLVDLIEHCGYARTPFPIQEMRLPAASLQIEDDRSYAFFPSAATRQTV